MKLDGIRYSFSSFFRSSTLLLSSASRRPTSHSKTSSSTLSLAISSASSDPSDPARSLHPFFLLILILSFSHDVLELPPTNHDWRDRLVRRQGATPRILLLCATRAMFVLFPRLIPLTLLSLHRDLLVVRQKQHSLWQRLPPETVQSGGRGHSTRLSQYSFSSPSSSCVECHHLVMLWSRTLCSCLTAWTRWSAIKGWCCRAWVNEHPLRKTTCLCDSFRDRKHVWTWRERCTVMPISICWTIHCRRSMRKCPNIFSTSEHSREVSGGSVTSDGDSICSSIKTYLHEKICILVTHQIQFLQDATKIIVLNNVRCSSESFDDDDDGCVF